MSKEAIRVVLHGGLGNQLFQYFIGRLIAKQRNSARLLLLPDLLANYGTSRVLELDPLIQAERAPISRIAPSDPVTRARLPKIVWRIVGREVILQVPGYGIVIDGYFQWASSYRACSRSHIDEVIEAWRHALVDMLQLKSRIGRHVTHIRLGDFFQSQDEAKRFAYARLRTLTSSTDLVTDQEDLVKELLATLHFPFAVKVVPTESMSAWDLLALFSQYARVSTNGSSLAFWGAVIGNNELESSNLEHMAIWRLLTAQS
jgi:hypothetical protein